MTDAPGPDRTETPLEIYAMPGHLIRRLHQASAALFDNAVRALGHDLTSVQFAAMMKILHTPGLDQASLAQAIGYDRATIGGVVDRLETKGYIRRDVDPNDRRARQLYLADAGRAVLDAVKPAVVAVQDDILAGLDTEERARFHALLVKALQAVGEVSRVSGKVR